MTLPSDYDARKALPIFSGVLKYFPEAIAAVAHCSKVGNDQHNPGQSLRWDRSKSTDEHNTCVRHLIEAGTFDTDGVRHSAKAAWRALAALQKEIEADGGRIHTELTGRGPAPVQPDHGSLCDACEIARAHALTSGHAGFVLCPKCSPTAAYKGTVFDAPPPKMIMSRARYDWVAELQAEDLCQCEEHTGPRR